MAVLVEFEGVSPQVAETAFVAPTAVLIGDVQVGPGASIWFGAVLQCFAHTLQEETQLGIIP